MCRVSLFDREGDFSWFSCGVQSKVIAQRIKRDQSVASWEVARHGVSSRVADQQVGCARARLKALALGRDPGLCAHVRHCLRMGWSPGSIAGDLHRHRLSGKVGRVCAQAIYGWVYAQPVSTLDRELIKLRSEGVTPCGAGNPPSTRISNPTYIDQRTLGVEGWQRPWPWEGDLVIGKAGKQR